MLKKYNSAATWNCISNHNRFYNQVYLTDFTFLKLVDIFIENVLSPSLFMKNLIFQLFFYLDSSRVNQPARRHITPLTKNCSNQWFGRGMWEYSHLFSTSLRPTNTRNLLIFETGKIIFHSLTSHPLSPL